MDNHQQEITMALDEVVEDSRVGEMLQPVKLGTAARMELPDEVVHTTLEEEADATGTMTKQVKTHIKSELVVPEGLELEVQAHVEPEAHPEEDQEEETEAMFTNQEAEVEAEAEEAAAMKRKNTKWNTSQTQRTATSAASKKL